MSEEILKAFMQLFALIVKQDAGVEANEKEYVKNFLTQQLNDETVDEYMELFAEFAGLKKEDFLKSKSRPTSVRDSVKIFGICKKINRTLTQHQKIIVLVRLFELVSSDKKFTSQRMNIINTVAEVFKISKEEFEDIQAFVIEQTPEKLDRTSILIISDKDLTCQYCKQISTKSFFSRIYILQIRSVDLYFLKHDSLDEIFLNGLPITNKRLYLFANGSSIRLSKGRPIYYSDIVSGFMVDETTIKISYVAENIAYKFPNGEMGIRNISFSEPQGKLVGIMGSSGTGKTTLLNLLSGYTKPASGNIKINGKDIHKDVEDLKGIIGYIPQDDLLIEELTIFKNLYFNAKLCFRNKSDNEIKTLVNKTLNSLGLLEKKDLKVGSPSSKIISGGQRKRLNIALELIREPAILFVDEPTSGLSSRDSENVMDLLRELTLKGKLIFIVIHQPSSDIFKMFDDIIILDAGGYMVYRGNPIEAIIYFKTLDEQINRDIAECPNCGTVNPEYIFNILEAQIVDEYGKYTGKRKVTPANWKNAYTKNAPHHTVAKIHEKPISTLRIPNWLKQFRIYTIRDYLSKISNTQYVLLNLLEAPLLAFILSYIIRYIADPNSDIYLFYENENIPIYIFMSLIVMLFLGLTVSAEEIFKDRKMIRRESFLNLSRTSYLLSKILILFAISAIQAILFVVIGNSILGIKGMFFAYWLALFTTAAFANLLGLNISASFNSAITIYIIIPLLLIPMMVLSGAMFSFDKLNRNIGSVDKVPIIAEMMATRWTYEALMVRQFKDNEFEKIFYDFEKEISMADYKRVHALPKLNDVLNLVNKDFNNDELTKENSGNLLLLTNELKKEMTLVNSIKFQYSDSLTPESYSIDVAITTRAYLKKLNKYYDSVHLENNLKRPSQCFKSL
ncbi:MAG: ATP-binding cassette domain-containing protein [Bacteroidetes bacterium]|nr:ATP-binding cassette domain-containing protein [Bacteroidota bacterium]